jgi:hypothetical protein
VYEHSEDGRVLGPTAGGTRRYVGSVGARLRFAVRH